MLHHELGRMCGHDRMGGRCHAIMACCARLRSRCKGSARSEHGSVMWPGLRPFGNAQAITRCGEPMQLSIVGKNFSPKIAPNSALRAFDGLCDDEAVPLICPTCQVSAQSVGSGDRLLLCMGLFSIFLAGAAATRRDSETPCPKVHMLARPLLQQNGAPEEIRTPDSPAAPANKNSRAAPTLTRRICQAGRRRAACAVGRAPSPPPSRRWRSRTSLHDQSKAKRR